MLRIETQMNCADLDSLLIEDDGVVLVGQQFVEHQNA